ncbi:MAG: hypothetical protein DHS20C02_20310 [Micavibrio sp.]|nr:MAG: hypothetical protein DHS20C02_20310 [Micavibrio sp.]
MKEPYKATMSMTDWVNTEIGGLFRKTQKGDPELLNVESRGKNVVFKLSSLPSERQKEELSGQGMFLG